MRSVLAFCLIFAVLFQSAGSLSYWLVFKLNQNNLAETVCINKNKPEKKCRACCFLEKKVKESEKKEKSSTSFKSLKTDWIHIHQAKFFHEPFEVKKECIFVVSKLPYPSPIPLIKPPCSDLILA